jgi:hypothetical protein
MLTNMLGLHVLTGQWEFNLWQEQEFFLCGCVQIDAMQPHCYGHWGFFIQDKIPEA